MDTDEQDLPVQPETSDSPNADEELDLDLELEDEEEGEQETEPKAEGSGKRKRFDEMTHEEAIAAAKKLWVINQKRKQKPATPAKPTKKPANSNPDNLSRDEVILIAKGYTEDELKVLKRIQAGAKADGEELSLLGATEDDVFKSWKSERERKRKADAAQLGTSNGNAYRKDDVKPGMTQAEHKELWKKQNG